MAKQSIAATLPLSERMASRTPTRSLVVFGLVVILFVALRFWKISSFSLWGGEAFTMIGVQQDWRGMFSYIIADIVHPPLFYILLKLWIILGGESVFWLKLLPVLTGIGVAVPFYLLCRELGFQRQEMSLALLMTAFNGYLIHYAQELRMYSLFAFLAMCSFWLFLRFFKTPGQATGALVWLTVVNLLAIYAHYYGWVVVSMELLFLLIWQRRKLLQFGLSVMILLMVFAPWAYVVIREAQSIGGLDRNLDWIPKPRVGDVLRLYRTFNGPLGSRYTNLMGLLLFGLPLLFWGWQLMRAGFQDRKDELVRFSWLALLAFVPVSALFLISQRMAQAIWIDRYFIFIAIPYLMLVASAAYQIKPLWLRNLWIAAIVIWSVLAGANDLRTNRMAWEGPQMGSRIDWESLTKQMIASESDPSGPINIYTLTIISRGLRTGDWASSTSLDYFLDAHGEDRFRFVYARDVHTLLNRTPLEDHFWIAFFELANEPQRSPAVALKDNGYRAGEAIMFQHLGNRLVLLPVWRE